MKHLVLSALLGLAVWGVTSLSPASADEVASTTDAGFAQDVLKNKEPVLVDFYATWCPPCKRMAPIVEDLAKEYKGRVKVLRVDVDQNPKIAEQYSIKAIPTFITYKNGKSVDSKTGAMPKAELASSIEKLLSN